MVSQFAAASSSASGSTAPIVDVITEDTTRFLEMLKSSVPERRVEGIQGLSNLKHWPGETALLKFLDDPDSVVRREAVLALGRIGSHETIPRFIELLDSPSWEIRRNAWLALCRMTAQSFPESGKAQWKQWWNSSTNGDREKVLLDSIRSTPAPVARRNAIRALRHMATPAGESAVIELLQSALAPALTADERSFLCEALERIGTDRAIPVLAVQRNDAAAWALGRVGGPDAEKALRAFPKSLPTLLALDRLHSTNAAPLVPQLVASMGLITFRSQPDDVMNDDFQPIQRVGANLLRRSGLAPAFFERVLQELEDTMKPRVEHGPRPPTPAEWDGMFQRMHSELKPGFVREDGTTTTQPLAAMCYAADDPALATRLIPLLKHPSFVVRVYVALTLGRLNAAEALPAIAGIIREGYAFSDSTALASGKHFDQSQTVRWRGFLCMALGRLGGDGARKALEEFAADRKQPRDIRYSAVVGLRFISAPESMTVLRRVAESDIVWMVRDEARQAIEKIEIVKKEAKRE